MVADKLPIVFMFPGQGCQYFHMARELYAEHRRFRACLQELDARIAPWIGESVLAHIYDERRRRSEPFTRLLISNPAIFMIEYAIVQLLHDAGIEPSLVLGASLGEVTAAAVSGALPLDDCIRIVVEIARVLEDAAGRGGMVAVLHAPSLYDEAPELHGGCELAGVNFGSHFVLSGPEADLGRAVAYLTRHGIAHQRLPIDHAFHSAFLDGFRGPLQACLAGLRYQSPRIGFASCATAKVMSTVDAAHYWQVLRGPTRFYELVGALEATGRHTYVDVGPSGTLSTCARQILPAHGGSSTCAVLGQFGQDLKTLARARAVLQRSKI